MSETKQLNPEATIQNAEAIEKFFDFFDKEAATKFLFDQLMVFAKFSASREYADSYVEDVVFNFQLLYDLISHLKEPYEE